VEGTVREVKRRVRGEEEGANGNGKILSSLLSVSSKLSPLLFGEVSVLIVR